MHVRELVKGCAHPINNPTNTELQIQACFSCDTLIVLVQGLPGSQGPIGLPGDKVGSVLLAKSYIKSYDLMNPVIMHRGESVWTGETLACHLDTTGLDRKSIGKGKPWMLHTKLDLLLVL